MVSKMFRRVVLTAVVCVVAGCGNKGELFIPSQLRLADETGAVNVSLTTSIDEVADDEVYKPEKSADVRR